MTKADLLLLYEYDRWANHRILDLCAALTPEQFTRDLGGAFPSVRDVLLHIVGGKWSWLTYWNEPSPTDEFLTDVFARSATIFRPEALPTLAAVQSKWAEIEKQEAKFLNAATDEQLSRLFPCRNTSISLAHLLQHVANHSTYHRGQVSLMLRQLGAKAEGTDFAEFFLVTADSHSHRAAHHATPQRLSRP